MLGGIPSAQPFCMAQQKMYSPTKVATLDNNCRGDKLRSTCCIFHQIAFRQGAAILDAIRQRWPFLFSTSDNHACVKCARG